MAAESAKLFSDFQTYGKKGRLLMNRLRDSGLEYVSSTGKLMPAKTRPEYFCHCPQKCKNKLSTKQWDDLFEGFYNLGDQNKQNLFLQNHIIIKEIHLHNWETEKSNSNKRRITCKYCVPNMSEDSELEEYVNERGKDTIEICQKAFMNCFGITEKRVRMQREKCISRLAPDYYKNSPLNKKQKVTKELEGLNLKFDLGSEIEIKPLDLSNDKGKNSNVLVGDDYTHINGKDQPLDLSCSNGRSYSALGNSVFENSTASEIAIKSASPKDAADGERDQRLGDCLRTNFIKPQMNLNKNRNRHSLPANLIDFKTEIENRRPTTLRRISPEHLRDVDEALTLPIETLNYGDLTIMPVVNSVPKLVETRDLMRVNSFFQNQLWQPELIGLSSWQKLK